MGCITLYHDHELTDPAKNLWLADIVVCGHVEIIGLNGLE